MPKERDSIVGNFILTIKPIEAVVRTAKSDSESADNGNDVPLINLAHKIVLFWNGIKVFKSQHWKKCILTGEGIANNNL